MRDYEYEMQSRIDSREKRDFAQFEEEGKFADMFEKAQEAGAAAAAACSVRPMTVIGGGREYFVEDGVCGFAWVNIKPGTSAFARWLMKTKRASKSYGGGVDIWVHEYGQSMQRKEAHAQAMAEKLRQLGVERAYSQSRMD